MSTVLATLRSGWYKARLDTQVTVADTPLSTDTKTWATRPTTKIVPIPSGANGVVLSFYGDNTAGDGGMENDTAVVKVYMYQEFGPAEEVYEVTVTVGAQEIGVDMVNAAAVPTGLWIDTVASTGGNNSTRWLTTVSFADHQADDGVAKMGFDAQGAAFMFVEVGTLATGLFLTPVFRYY
jgi:hypothetical protein